MVARRKILLALVLTLALTACGSTLQPTAGPSGGAANDLTAGDGLTSSSDGLSFDSLGNSDTNGPGSGSSGRTAVTAPGAGRTPTAVTSRPASTVTGPLRIGVIIPDVAALAAVFGVSTGGAADPFDADREMVAYINKKGGIAGRKVELKEVTIDAGGNMSTEGQSACEEFTEQNKVDVVMAGEFSEEVMIACLRQRGVPVIGSNHFYADETWGNEFPSYFNFAGMRLDRRTTAQVENAVALGLLKRGDKLGVLYEDCPWGARTYEKIVKPLAVEYGLTTERATIKCIENLIADLGPVTNQANAAALRFRSTNVTHAIFLTSAEAFVFSQFGRAAAQQQYKPKYFITTSAFPHNSSAPDSPTAYSDQVKKDTTGIGWIRSQDTGKVDPASAAQAAKQAECRSAVPTFSQASYETEQDRNGAYARIYSVCDVYLGYREMVSAAAGRTGIADVGVGYQTMMPNFVSAYITGGQFGPVGNRRDGPSFIQPFKSNPSGRFSYSGDLRKVS